MDRQQSSAILEFENIRNEYVRKIEEIRRYYLPKLLQLAKEVKDETSEDA